MKSFLIISAFTLVGSCATTKYSTKIENLKNSVHVTDSTLIATYAETITAKELEKNLYDFASSTFEGRKTGQEGQKKAVKFLEEFYKKENIAPAMDSSYFQTIPESFLPDGIGSSENVLAYIEGYEYPEELLIVSGHLDHLGMEDDTIHFGADDNGSGSMAILEIAQAFKIAEMAGCSPKRSILFIHLTAEEIGLYGSQYYVKNPVFKLENTIANLNIDMIGRVDNKHEGNSNYIYVIGADRISKELHYVSEKVNNTFYDLELDYTYNEEDDPNHYYYRSDHYNFAKQNIPVIFYFNGEHKDYHKPTDTADKINYELLEIRTKLIFATAWHLANQNHRLLHNDDI